MEHPHLLAPLELRGIRLANRVLMGSMHTGLEDEADFTRLAAFYAERARGGVGLIVTGGIAPNPEGAPFPGSAKLTEPAEVARHRQVTEAVHAEGGRIVMQVMHTGRSADAPDCVGPSAIRSPISRHTPRALDEAGIEAQLADFGRCAALAREAGYDGVELMGSEGYLINQFLVRHANRREDRWGGSAENRMRFAVEAVRRTRAALGADRLLVYRISLLDLIPDGQTWDEVVRLAHAVEDAGADILNGGIGWHESRVPTIAASVPRAAFAWAAARLRTAVRAPVAASNRINAPETAERLLAEGACDLVSMARPLLADAAFVRKAAEGRAAEIAPCIACNQACIDHTFQKRTASCLVNPRACHETELTLAPAAVPRRIAVVGAGAAGLAAALTAAERGHRVTLFDEADEVGGQLRLAREVPGKEEFRGLVAFYAAELVRLGVTVRLGARVGAQVEAGALAGFDAVVMATGVIPRDPGIPGQDGPNVAGYAEVLSGRVVPGPRVAIVGAGGIGFDVAEYLAHAGPPPDLAGWRAIWGVGDPAERPGGLAEPAPRPAARRIFLCQRRAEKHGAGLGKTTGWIHRASLRGQGVEMVGGVDYLGIGPRGLRVGSAEAPEGRWLEVDTVVLCAGQEPRRELAPALARLGVPIHRIGGADEARELDAKRAIDQGVRLAARL